MSDTVLMTFEQLSSLADLALRNERTAPFVAVALQWAAGAERHIRDVTAERDELRAAITEALRMHGNWEEGAIAVLQDAIRATE